MGFDNIKKKGESMGKKPMAQVLKVNKYEDPQMALNLIAHICTAANSLDFSKCFDRYSDVLEQLNKEIEGSNLLNVFFVRDCIFKGIDLENELASTLSSSIKIAVAGGFSAGKSSLLNNLTKIGNLLPTGVEPVSVVNTYLNCQSNIQKPIIRGKNLKDEFVLLNEEVLACIQHSAKSKTYVAPVLDKIIINTPTEKYLDGITFVDTPGYNNSTSNAESDRQKAIDAMSGCDAIFWCIDIESGTLTKNDLSMLKQFIGKPIVILYTKMDKKSTEDIKRIVKDSEAVWTKEFGRENMPVSIMAISCVNKQKYSSTHLTFGDIIKSIKKQCGFTNLLTRYKKEVEGLFDEELKASTDAIDSYEKQRVEQIKDKDEWYEIYRNNKEYSKSIKEHLKNVMIDSYSEIMECANKRLDCFSKAIDGWCEALNRENEWADKSGIFSDTSSLSQKHAKAIDAYTRLCNKELSYNYWEIKNRNELYEDICERYDVLVEKCKNDTESSESVYKQIIKNKKNEEKLKSTLVKYRLKATQALEEAYNASLKKLKADQEKMQKLEKTKDTDVFSAISGDNYERFLSCFSDGVDLTVCNPEGYSPITWAVRSGNNEMVKFFINHDTDLSMKDKRGYNALETAAICHYQDMCELLMEADHNLINESQPLSKLATLNYFTNWVSKIK